MIKEFFGKIFKNGKRQPVSFYKKKAYDCYLAGKYKKALKLYKYVIEKEPLESNNYYNAGLMCHCLNDRENALFYYDVALKLNPKNISAVVNAGLAFFEENNPSKAKEFFDYAINTAPDHPEAYHHSGVIYSECYNDNELAVAYLKKAVYLDPGYSDNYYKLASVYNKMNKKEEAVLSLEKCLELNPKHKKAKEFLAAIKN